MNTKLRDDAVTTFDDTVMSRDDQFDLVTNFVTKSVTTTVTTMCHHRDDPTSSQGRPNLATVTT